MGVSVIVSGRKRKELLRLVLHSAKTAAAAAVSWTLNAKETSCTYISSSTLRVECLTLT